MSSETLHHRRDSCRACGGSDLESFLNLGPQPPANAFPATPAEMESERRFPLEVFICTTCGLVQLLDIVDPTVLYRDYPYVTGTSVTMAEHNRRYARLVHDRLSLAPGDLVVEVASNDGSMLSIFSELGARTLGIEPAENIAAIAVERGIATINRFFDAELALEVRAGNGVAKAVLANNVLAHVDDPIGFLRGCRELIDEDGLIVIEVPYARDMLDRGEYDTIYHEHLSYFAIGPLSRIVAAAGLAVLRIETLPIHGGSMRAWLSIGTVDTADVASMAGQESRSGVTTAEAWRRFGTDAARHRDSLVHHLEQLRDGGARLAGYGAPAKGSTLLNYCGTGPDLIPFTVDRNPHKVGRWMPGTHVPVLDVEALQARQPSHVLILPWNLAAEIVGQQQDLTASGCRWLVPFPLPHEM